MISNPKKKKFMRKHNVFPCSFEHPCLFVALICFFGLDLMLLYDLWICVHKGYVFAWMFTQPLDLCLHEVQYPYLKLVPFWVIQLRFSCSLLPWFFIILASQSSSSLKEAYLIVGANWQQAQQYRVYIKCICLHEYFSSLDSSSIFHFVDVTYKLTNSLYVEAI